MAQTIALQRGEVTLSNNTSTLLFTNTSSGTSTRMMVGYLSFASNFSSVAGGCTFGILRSGESSPNFSLFAGSAGYYNRFVTFSPSNTRSGWHGNSGGANENTPFMNSDGTTPLISGSCLSLSNNPARVAWYNTDVMLGPSDAVYCGWSDNGGGNRAAVIQYCIVLVTE